jgi:hypothetical protein
VDKNKQFLKRNVRIWFSPKLLNEKNQIFLATITISC